MVTVPSSAQARILKTLNIYHGLAIIWNQGARGAEWTGPSWPLAKRELGNPKTQTLKKMIREGWLENIEDTPFFWRISKEGKKAFARYNDVAEGSEYLKLAITVDDIRRGIRRRHPSWEDWIYIEEVALPMTDFHQRRIDVLAILDRMEPTIEAYEIKVNRGDFLRELEYQSKRIPAMAISNYFWFATPFGLIEPDEIPDGCGLITFDPANPSAHWIIIEAPYMPADPPDWRLVVEIARILSKR